MRRRHLSKDIKEMRELAGRYLEKKKKKFRQRKHPKQKHKTRACQVGEAARRQE